VPQTAHRRRRPGVLQDHRPVRSPLAGHPRRAGQPVSPQGTGDSRLARSPTTSPLAPALDPHLELMAQPRAAMVQGTHRSARRRGTFTSVPALIEAIQTWVSHRNQDPKPFIWHAAAGETPEKVRRGRKTLSQVRSTTQHQGQLAGWVQVGTRGTLLSQRPNRGGVHCESVPMANGNRRSAAAPGSRTHAHPERAASSIGRRSGRAPAMPAYLAPSARDGPPAPRPPPRGLDRRAWRRTARRRPLRPPREPGPDGPPLPRP